MMRILKNENPIEEIWRIRDELGAEEGYDVHTVFEILRRNSSRWRWATSRPPKSAVTSHRTPGTANAEQPRVRVANGQMDGDARGQGGK
jgi:hypothetical protein